MLALGIAVGVVAALVVATFLGTWIIERRHPPAGRFVPVTGGRLHVLEAGAGDDRLPVVLLHGASVNLHDLRLAIGGDLAADHRVIMIDRPGHGWSERPGGKADAAPARQADLVAEALERLGIARAVVVGHSWSGALATALALRHPQRLAGLVLLAPATHPFPGGLTWYYTAAAVPVLGTLLAYTVAVPLGWLLIPPGLRWSFGPQPRPPHYRVRAALALALRPAQFRANAQDLAALSLHLAAQAPLYPQIRVPTVVVTGDRDRVVSPRVHARATAAAIPNAELIVLPGVGHMPHHAAPERVVAAIRRLAAAERSAAAG
jgi:pimeloyl-ACP methyl ester carboxylesterase